MLLRPDQVSPVDGERGAKETAVAKPLVSLSFAVAESRADPRHPVGPHPDRGHRRDLRQGRAADRRLPAHGTQRRVRCVRACTHDVHHGARAGRAVRRLADLRRARVPPWRPAGPPRRRHPHAQGSRRQEGRRARLLGNHRRVDPGHPHRRVRPRQFESDLGGGRRGARDRAGAAGQRGSMRRLAPRSWR